MKFTLSWLKEHLDTSASLETILDTLTAIGLEVESVDDPAARLASFTIAEIKTAVRHPDADKLQVCTVDTGQETLQIVCGAPNARAGMKTVLASVGTYVPGIDITLKKGVIRGQESFGMLCSASELQIAGDASGILEVAADAPVGAGFANWAGLSDPVIEINLTPNRGDCAGVRGVARDLVAAGLGSLKPNRSRLSDGKGTSPIQVTIETDAELCPVFVYRIIRGVKNGPSPDWVQRRLTAIGQRPISSLVDVTNLMTIDQNRPMHVFDAAKVHGNLVIRTAQSEGECFQALNEKEYELSPPMVVIADNSGAVSLAGIMGGETTGCTEETTDVLVEAAIWQPANIARTGRKLDCQSDARFRFERGTDPSAVVEGMEIATHWIVDFCGGEPGEIHMAGQVSAATQNVRFRTSRVASLGGMDVPEKESLEILQHLGFKAKTAAQGEHQVSVPPWRSDIQGEADLVEEVVRIRGLDAIPAVSLDRESPLPSLAFEYQAQQKRKARRSLANRGLYEAVTWSFLPGTTSKLFDAGGRAPRLQNAMSVELDTMRTSLLPNLLAAAGRNADRGYADVGLFEVGTVFHGVDANQQPQHVAAIRAGLTNPRHWRSNEQAVDAFLAKQDCLSTLEAVGAPVRSLRTVNLQDIPDAPSYFHPGRSAALTLGKATLAHFGEIHPRVLAAMGVRGPVVGMEIYLEAIPVSRKRAKTARPLLSLASFQSVERDFAFIVPQGIPADEVLSAAASADKQLITDTTLFDIYQGKGVDDGSKSLAISVTIQPTEKSLTDADLETLAAKIIEAVKKKTGGELRA